MSLFNEITKEIWKITRSLHVNKDQPCVMVDIGSFRGDVTKEFLREFECGKSYAIEACPMNYKFIAKRFMGDKRVTPCNVAITDGPGCISFFVSRHKKYKKYNMSSQANSIYESFLSEKQWAKNREKIVVEGISLDDFIKLYKIEYIDILKINCEGGEYAIFESDTKNFLKASNVVYIALHCKSNFFNTVQFQEKREYINEVIMNSGFSLIKGDKDVKVSSDNHIEQLWIRNL